MPLVVALTGDNGSAKSRVAAILEELGAAIIDTDKIAHRLTAGGQPGARAIRKQFGPAFLLQDGAPDGERMRQLVFSDPTEKERLEAMLHPMIRADVSTKISAAVQCRMHPPRCLMFPRVRSGPYRGPSAVSVCL